MCKWNVPIVRYFQSIHVIQEHHLTFSGVSNCMKNCTLCTENDLNLQHLDCSSTTVILEILDINIFVGPLNDEILKHEKNSYNEKLYLCVPKGRKLNASNI